MAAGEPDQRDIIGYSIRGKSAKADWIALVTDIEAYLEESGRIHDVVFHGTSLKRLPAILSVGLKPTETDLAAPGKGSGYGSFWGSVRTAAAYAEDTAKERDSSMPVLLAARTDTLLQFCELVPDLATLDFPLKGLTRLDEPGVAEAWFAGHAGKSWRESLDDLGAAVAIHDRRLPPDAFVRIESFESVRALLGLAPGLRF